MESSYENGRRSRPSTGCVLVLICCIVQCSIAAKPCVSRYFDHGGTVCVCNATHCDTIDPATPVPTGQYIIYSSSIDGLRMNKSAGDFTGNTTLTSRRQGIRFMLHLNRTLQTIFGFGTAFTDAAGINLLSLDPPAQELLLRSYFSPDGIELNFGRVPIAGTDFSTHPYTYDDEANDTSLDKFNLTKEDFEIKIPIIFRAHALSHRELKLLAAAWSSPPWTKTNNDYSGFGFLKPEHSQYWAKYHVKFLDSYQSVGIRFWGVSTGNEPTNGIIPVNRFNSLGWTPYSHRDWIAKNLGPSIRASQHNSTQIIALDDQRFLLPWWIDKIFEDPGAKAYVDGIGVHWYWDTVASPTRLRTTHDKYPEKFILATEACVGDKPWEFEKVMLGSWSRGEQYIRDIIEDLNNWVTGWIDWNFALNMEGGPNWVHNYVDSAVIVNAEKNEFYKQPMFYALGHFSKFVTEGSKRIKLTRNKNRAKNIEVIAFLRPDQAVVVILFNGNDATVSVTLEDARRGRLLIEAPKRSFHTILYW